MHYVALVKGGSDGTNQETAVEIQELAPFQYRITLDGKEHHVDARALRTDSLSLRVGDEIYDIESEEDPSGAGQNLLVRGELVTVEVVDVRTLHLRKAASTHSSGKGPREVRSPMPGKVVAVLAKDGDTVTEGQGLLVIEAMKMENELKSPKAGIVKKLAIQQGAVVEGNAVLCVVE
jgi:biotin carboxyl carrier protein